MFNIIVHSYIIYKDFIFLFFYIIYSFIRSKAFFLK